MAHPDYEHIGSEEDRLIEECAELIQAVTKGKRFGWKNFNPLHTNTNNYLDLIREFEDVKKCFANLFLKLQPEVEELLKP